MEVLAAGLQQCHSVHVRVCACVRVTIMCVVSGPAVGTSATPDSHRHSEEQKLLFRLY